MLQINKFTVLGVDPSKSRNGGANVRCSAITEHKLFGDALGMDFIIQTNDIPTGIEGKVVTTPVSIEEVDYKFTRDGEEVHAHYFRGYI